MFEKHKKLIAKYLGLVLQHQPDLVGLSPDDDGWVNTELLLKSMNKAGRRCNREQLETVVAADKRFQFNKDNSQIRAAPGLSLNFNTGLDG